MAYGPGVDEINYSDLPPIGDTVNSAFQKTQNQLDALYTGLNNDIVRASKADVNTATDTTKLITPGTLLKGKANGVASLDALGKVTGTELPDASETVKGVVKVGSNISVADGVISVSVPDATKTVKGVVKVGSNISVADGVISVSVPDATKTVKGVVKVGSNISVADGVISVSVPDATETVKGVVELATPAEVLAGVDTERAVTPAGFKAALASTPCYYSRSAPFAPTKTTIVTPVRLWVNIALDGYIKEASETLDLTLEATWDSISPDYRVASARAGKDFYIYACAQLDGTFKYLLSANSTVPTGYTADNSRKIGGFHCLCVSVGTISGHTLSGYVEGDILPASVWDLAHRPASEPEGMVYVSGLNLWVDIYLSSFSDGKLKSAYGGVTADGASATKFHGYRFDEYFGLIKKKSLWQYEFEVASQGSNQLTNIAGSADPNTTGGHVDTASRRMVSNYGLEDCCGALYQWCRDSAEFTPGGTWGSPSSYLYGYGYKNIVYDSTIETSQGQTYGIPRRVLVGGYWDRGVVCGSRCSHWDHVPSALDSSVGCRGASEPSRAA